MILRKCRIENPASSAAVGISKNIFVRAGWAAVSVNIGLYPPFRRVLLHLVYQCVSPSERGTHTWRRKTQRRTRYWLERSAIFPTKKLEIPSRNRQLSVGYPQRKSCYFLLQKVQQTALSEREDFTIETCEELHRTHAQSRVASAYRGDARTRADV